MCVLSQVPSKKVKKVFVRVPSSISQHGGKANRMPFQSMGLVMSGESIKTGDLQCQVLHSIMANIIPLPFETTLSASELVQVMQHLEHHLAHVVNI